LGQPYAHLGAINKYVISTIESPDNTLIKRLKVAKALRILTVLAGALFLVITVLCIKLVTNAHP